MISSTYRLDIERLIILFFVFVLSTIALFIELFSQTLNNIVKQVLFYFGFFGLGFVILAILFYYFSKVNSWLKKDQIRIGVTIAVILALGHSLFIGLDNHSWYSFFGYLTGDGLIIIVGLFIFLKWEKKRKK